ncbi:hypothetical protein JAAARDRAFT_28868 [Jaapia argillacea MUCL 33604]|uniref:Uncharacterized protein n=1 Tax=Jaapia argillacea MUCL 33604 TaxID=933084 RepID=A0A067QHA4_9AGAM|nr:hypothetical protein JAAARDRAFT_28868 [Jaapia argillacea MUCL 33604]
MFPRKLSRVHRRNLQRLVLLLRYGVWKNQSCLVFGNSRRSRPLGWWPYLHAIVYNDAVCYNISPTSLPLSGSLGSYPDTSPRSPTSSADNEL